VSRLDAAVLFHGVCKTGKMHSLRQEHLASALQLEKASAKANLGTSTGKWTIWMNKESRIEGICAEADGDVLPLTRVKLSLPRAVPQRTPRTTSQNPQERRDSLP